MNIEEVLGISFTNLYIWMGFGLIVGIIAHLEDKRKVMGGAFSTVLFGVAGAVLGGVMASMLLSKLMFDFSLEGFFIAVFSALVMTVIFRGIFRNTGNIRVIKE